MQASSVLCPRSCLASWLLRRGENDKTAVFYHVALLCPERCACAIQNYISLGFICRESIKAQGNTELEPWAQQVVAACEVCLLVCALLLAASSDMSRPLSCCQLH